MVIKLARTWKNLGITKKKLISEQEKGKGRERDSDVDVNL